MDNTFELSDKELQSITGGMWSFVSYDQAFYASDDFSGEVIGGTAVCTNGWCYGTQSGYQPGSDPSDPSDPSPFGSATSGTSYSSC